MPAGKTLRESHFPAIEKRYGKTMKYCSKFPDLDLVIAWNYPMLKMDNSYIFGVSTAKNHILIAPWDAKTFKKYAKKFVGCKINKKTIGVPNDWVVDKKLLQEMINYSLASSKS